ncbi:S9 family peptidase [Antarcticibacterium flavum]|uniref:S9 family peptidase n=1 Tax=Antarcticibacterium flavum TaxID=2058175 RepID=A0A5B7X390_9FLAO|nr:MULTISPECIES: S9 family peptidase [Antarcticibacterium]MCM4161324.1 S9 family peptidase [Antarcticibacterium sp. W02-3]QCY69103.1 S9 family peptidase [Antarcticibacterium flavum]
MKKYIALLVFFIAHTVTAQENVLTAQDVAKIEAITNIVISQDGQKIAYQKVVPANPLEENVPAKSHLYIYDLSSKESTPLVTDYSISNIKFRPGSGSITFTAKRDKDEATAVYEMQPGGGDATKIYEFQTSISSYDWHSNGTQLAFVANKPQDKRENELPYTPEVYETDLENSTAFVTNLNDPTPKELAVEGHVTSVQWSPKGSQLAVAAAPTSLVDDFYTSQKIYIVDANTLNITAEVDHKGKQGPMKWSPDGKRIAFIAGEDQHDPIDGRLFIAEVTGGSPKILQKDFKGKFDGLDWKDNKTLYIQVSEGVYSSLGTIGLDGKMDKLFREEAMNITRFAVAGNNTIATTANTAQHPDELFVIKPKAGTAERITTSNPWLAEEKMGKQEVITYKAADGLEIEGILIHPINKSGKSPLITVVHGGPEAHYSNGWLTSYNMPGQLGAGEGYAVFYPNYRGSTGRGIEFAKSSQGDPAGLEFDDIIDGVDYLIENYDIDKDKVGVTGGSYGGYATAWMATRHTKRFAAGVMSVGISNNISKWGTSDIPEEMFLVHARKRIWDDYEFYLERSPIFYADQAETPLLILHGKDDTRVNPGQSYELYRHIKTRTETPVRLVLYPGEGHGNRKSTARYDYNLRMMQWFDTYLKDGSITLPDANIAPDGQ